MNAVVPTGTGNQGKPGKWKGIFQSGNFVKTGKVREFYSKYWKNWKKLYWKIEKNTGNVREICQPVIVKTLQIWYNTLNKKRTLKNTGKLRKILEKSGKFVSPKKWEPWNALGKTFYSRCQMTFYSKIKLNVTCRKSCQPNSQKL